MMTMMVTKRRMIKTFQKKRIIKIKKADHDVIDEEYNEKRMKYRIV